MPRYTSVVDGPPPPPSPVTASRPPGLSSTVRVLIVVAVVLALGMLAYGPFLFGEQVMLYKGIGSDSLNEDYPNAVHLSGYLRSDGVPRWSFQLGIGQALYPCIALLLYNPVAWLPQEQIATALAWQQLLKVLVAGVLFAGFLRVRGIALPVAAAGGVLLGLSGYMCIGACWSIAANELLGFTYLLLAIELAVVRGRWIHVPIAVALLGILTVFHLYLAAVLLLLYTPVRLIAAHGWRFAPLAKGSAGVGAAALVGCGLAAVIALENASLILDSPRAPGTASGMARLAGAPLLGFESAQYYVTSVLRWFSTDLVGTGDGFRGWYNYFEAPVTYCGLLMLLLFPQVFGPGGHQRRRTLAALFVAFLVIPVALPWFRYAFWAFQGDYFRALSLFQVFGVLALSLGALSRYLRDRQLSLPLLAASLVVLLGLLWGVPAAGGPAPSQGLQGWSTVYLTAYTVILAGGYLLRRQAAAVAGLLLVGAVELVHFDRITLARRNVVLKTDLTLRTGYNDHTVDAVRDLRRRDPGFYRVAKLYSSSPAVHESFNDDMVFGYFGTGSYSSFNDMDYVRFLAALDVISKTPTETETRWIRGLADRPLLSTFAGEKYLLTRDPAAMNADPGYEFVARHGDVHVFRNRSFLPFGLSFSRYVPQSEFLGWPPSAKEHALFYAAVLPDGTSEERAEIARTPLARMNLDELTELVQREPLRDAMAQHQRGGFRMRSFSQNRITGSVHTPRDSVLVFQTAYSSGWKATIDGVEAPLGRADIGMLGLAVPAGEHDVVLRYLPALLPAGITISLISLGLLVVAHRRWPLLRPSPRRMHHAAADAADELAASNGARE